MHLHVQALTFAFADAAPLVTEATVTLSAGWTGPPRSRA
jgi:hypothetical protein